jgi:hypothetical protein
MAARDRGHLAGITRELQPAMDGRQNLPFNTLGGLSIFEVFLDEFGVGQIRRPQASLFQVFSSLRQLAQMEPDGCSAVTSSAQVFFE